MVNKAGKCSHDFVFGNQWKTNNISTGAENKSFHIDQEKTPVRRIDLFQKSAGSQTLAKIVMYDDAGRQLMHTGSRYTYHKKT